MYKTSIVGQWIELDYADTSLKEGRPTWRRLKPWLMAFLAAAEEFLWSRRAGSLRLQRPSKGARVHLSLLVCGKAKMKNLNERFRGKPRPTDVLSLQYIEDISELTHQSWGPFPFQLGDLFLCRDVAKKQARQYQLSFEEEFVHLLVHGFLHTLNYDHERGVREEKEMEEKEKWMIQRVRAHLKKRGK